VLPRTFSTDTKPEQPLVEEWVQAQAGSVSTVRVKVMAVAIDAVKGEDGKRLHPTQQQLVINITVENLSKGNITYRGAGDPSTKFGERASRLTDDVGKPYRVVDFGKTTPISGQLGTTEISPDGSVADVLVFDRPSGNTQWLKLELPGANFGGTGRVKMKIPMSFVVVK